MAKFALMNVLNDGHLTPGEWPMFISEKRNTKGPLENLKKSLKEGTLVGEETTNTTQAHRQRAGLEPFQGRSEGGESRGGKTPILALVQRLSPPPPPLSSFTVSRAEVLALTTDSDKWKKPSKATKPSRQQVKLLRVPKVCRHNDDECNHLKDAIGDLIKKE